MVVVHLLRVSDEWAVILKVWNSVVVCIWVTVIANTILVSIQLVCIVGIGTVVILVRYSIQVPIEAVITSVTNEVVVVVILVLIEDIWAIVTNVSYSITILVSLIRIVHTRTVVLWVGDEVIVNVWIAHIPQLVSVCVLLLRVADSFAVVACIPSPIPIPIFLFGVGMERAIVIVVQDTISVSIRVTRVTKPIIIR